MKNSAFYEPSPYKPRGLAYVDWIKKWYEWAQSIKRAENPAIDATGKNCSQMQNGSVWFLAGTVGGSVNEGVSYIQVRRFSFQSLMRCLLQRNTTRLEKIWSTIVLA